MNDVIDANAPQIISMSSDDYHANDALGSTGARVYTKRPLSDRFHEKWIPEPNSGCWLWTAAIKIGRGAPTDLRGVIGLGSRSEGTVDAHRASWLVHRGNIPDGIDVCHTCDVPLCVNPDHLFLGTRKENMKDSLRKGRYTKRSHKLGESHPAAILNENDVRAIRASNGSSACLAPVFGVSDVTIRAIRQRRIWKHVP